MIETQGKGVLGTKCAAEANAAEERELLPPLQQQPQDLEKILVPAHGDAILGDAAEARHDAFVQILVQARDVANGLERYARTVYSHAGEMLRQRFDLQAIDTHHAMPVVEQVVSEAEARRPHSGHQHFVAAGLERERPANVEGIPAREQRIDFKSPGQLQDVFQGPGFRLRDVDGFLLLIDAGLHAIVADPMTRGRHHGIVDGDDSQSSDREAFGFYFMELGNFLFQRTTCQGHGEGAFLEYHFVRGAGGGFFAQSRGAGILALRVAPDAVIGFV